MFDRAQDQIRVVLSCETILSFCLKVVSLRDERLMRHDVRFLWRVFCHSCLISVLYDTPLTRCCSISNL